MSYTVTLFDCQIRDNDKRAAEIVFCNAIENELGGASAVAQAYRAYRAAFSAHGELPLPAHASDIERAAVERWETAEAAGCRSAFDGWHSWPRGAHFQVECSE